MFDLLPISSSTVLTVPLLFLLGAMLFAAPLPLIARAWRAGGGQGGAACGIGQRDHRGAVTPGDSRPPAPRLALVFRARQIALRAPWWFAAVPVTALAFGLRLYRYDRLSMWLDEGLTMYYARLPWPRVLGLQGQYDNFAHPPLYYATVKLTALVVPEVHAGRLLSVVAGALTVGVLYALVARLVNRAAALSAGLILAVSPLHVWYSQEARMYATSVLLVAVSYLALAAFHQNAQNAQNGPPQWAIVYAVAVLLAMYIDYTAAYALAPQIPLLALLAKRHGRRARVLLCGTLGAAICYLPWAFQAAAAMRKVSDDRLAFMAATPARIAGSLLAIVGLSGQTSYYWGNAPTPWAVWPHLHGTFLLALVPVILVGATALTRRYALAGAVALGLFAGTIGAAMLVSMLLSPGYADRTVLYAVLGWAVFAGAAPFGAVPNGGRAAGLLGIACLLTLSLLSLGAIYRGAEKQQYRQLAHETALAAASGRPVFVPEGATATLIDLYTSGTAVHVYPSRLPLVEHPAGGAADALWLAHGPYDNIEAWTAQLAARGYERVQQQYFPDPLYLELYARPGARPGAATASAARATPRPPHTVGAAASGGGQDVDRAGRESR